MEREDKLKEIGYSYQIQWQFIAETPGDPHSHSLSLEEGTLLKIEERRGSSKSNGKNKDFEGAESLAILILPEGPTRTISSPNFERSKLVCSCQLHQLPANCQSRTNTLTFEHQNGEWIEQNMEFSAAELPLVSVFRKKWILIRYRFVCVLWQGAYRHK